MTATADPRRGRARRRRSGLRTATSDENDESASMHRSSAEVPSADGRVIIHLDLDAFYAQVESRRLGIDPSAPLVVQQWRGIIAVNYAARAAGIKRHLTVDEAAKLCPGVVFVHVETIGDDEDDEDDERNANETRTKNDDDDDEDDALRRAATYRPSDDAPSASARDAVTSRSAGLGLNPADPPDRERRKVSLARYRRASRTVMETLADAFPDGAVERASIDEAYVDVTREVDAILRDENENENDVSSRVASGVNASGFVRALRPDASVSDRRLALGADACRRARAAVFAKTGYTMSGGIAHNKMLAKLASARNKPNRQTVVSRAATAEMLETLPMRSIKGLGGKLGERVERALVEVFSVEDSASRSEMERKARSGTGRGSSFEGGFTAASLRALFSAATSVVHKNKNGLRMDDKTSVWLERVSRGEDSDPVVANVRDGAKSVTAFKSFKAVFEKEKAHRWLKVLARELAERLNEDRRRLRRAPRTVRLEYRAEPNKNANPPRATFETRSKTFAFPANATTALASGNVDDAGDALTEAALRVFDALGPETTLPCTRVGLAASEFVPTPVAGNGIERFFKDARPAKRRVEDEVEDEPDDAGLVETEKKNDDDDDVDASVRAVLAASDEDVDDETFATREVETKKTLVAVPPDNGGVFAGDAPSTFVACPRCGLRTASGRDAQSHADEHMAFDLSKSEPQHRFGSKNFSSLSSGGSKRRPAARGGGGKKRARGDTAGTVSMRAFFAKK